MQGAYENVPRMSAKTVQLSRTKSMQLGKTAAYRTSFLPFVRKCFIFPDIDLPPASTIWSRPTRLAQIVKYDPLYLQPMPGHQWTNPNHLMAARQCPNPMLKNVLAHLENSRELYCLKQRPPGFCHLIKTYKTGPDNKIRPIVSTTNGPT